MTGATRERPNASPTATERQAPRAPRLPDATVALSWLLPLLALAVALAAWEIGVWIDNTPRWFLPKPTDIAREMVTSRALLLDHTWTTAQEVLVGLALAFALGVMLAVAIASSRLVERAIYPAIVASQAIPIIALAPILLIWFGYGMTPKVIVVVLICFFPIVVSMVDGLRAADPDAIALLRSMGASRVQIMRIVRVPASLPNLFSGLRIAAAVSVIGALVGEWVGASSGLGYLMTRSAAQFQTPRLFAAVTIAALMGVLLFALVALVERLALPWRAAERRGGRRGGG
ncbi:MAG TPA: ABC transporter permease [Thermomicrobiales bacterium]|nr:ABC transporter permease [Thermomicrobiales bacterium]